MAYMIPEVPRKYEPKSKEGQMFFSLEKLPHEYYVVHSLKTTNMMASGDMGTVSLCLMADRIFRRRPVCMLLRIR